MTIGAVIAPERLAPLLGIENLNYTFLLRIWSGMAFLWGCLFWEIANDMRGKRYMIKYTWIEKCVTAVSVTIAFVHGQVGWACFGLILYTDYLWILLFLFYDVIMRGGAPAESAMAEAEAAVRL